MLKLPEKFVGTLTTASNWPLPSNRLQRKYRPLSHTLRLASTHKAVKFKLIHYPLFCRLRGHLAAAGD